MRVLVVDDDGLIRDSLSLILGLEADIEVCATAANSLEALELCAKHKPDIVLMDIRMPVLDGVEGTKRIKERFPEIYVVILTTFQDDEYIRQAIQYGAEGYILKNQSSDSIIDTLRAVLKGNAVFQRDVAQKLNTMLKSEQPSLSKLTSTLTQRELDVLACVGQGKSNKEIASELFLSEGTVRNYVTGLLEKLELRDRTQLAIFYLKNFT